jgi:tetraacyldisaccharide 4'-kinase
VQETGDEPLLIFKSASGASVIIGAKRYENALRFEKEIKPDVYVLDDGFQHWKIKRDLDIVCINAANPFGNGLLIPAGILRENLSALKRAAMIIITNADMVLPSVLEKLKEEIYGISGKVPFVTRYGEYELRELDLQTKFDEKLLKSRPLYSLSAIGFDAGFKNSIEKYGLRLSGSFVLKDHKNYDAKEIENIFRKTGENARIITTAKDAVKLDAVLTDELKNRFAVLKVKPVFETGKEKWEKEILNVLPSF